MSEVSGWAAAEQFVSQFKSAGFTGIYVQRKDDYLKALKAMTPNDIIVYTEGNKSHVILQSDTGADYLTITFEDGNIKQRGDYERTD